MDNNLRGAWMTFILEGHWQKDLPTQPGTYFLRTSDGYSGGTGTIYRDPVTGTAKAVSPWGGDWWSHPIPTLPDTRT